MINVTSPNTTPWNRPDPTVLCTPAVRHKPQNKRQSSSVQIRTPGSVGRGQKTPRLGSTSNTPYTASSHVSNDNNSSTIVAIVEGRGQARGEIGISSLDLREPVLVLTQFSDGQTYSKTLSMLYHTSPLEILVPNTLWESSSNKLFNLLSDHFPTVTVSSVQRRYFNESKGLQCVKHLCATEYKSIELQISSKYYCLATAAALLKYVEHIQNIIFAPSSLKVVFKACDHITMIDAATVKNLELLQNLQDPMSQDSLFGVLNHTQTQGGARLLRSNILQPVKDEETIRLRQQSVMELTEKEDIFFNLQSVVGRFVDIGYIVSLCIQTPKQETARTAETKLNCVLMLKHVLQLVVPLRENLSNCENQLFKTYYQALESSQYQVILDKIGEVISEDAHFQKGLAQQRAQKCCAVKLAEHHKLPLRMAYSSLRGFHIQMNSNNGDQGTLPPVFIKVAKFKSTLSFTTMDLGGKSTYLRQVALLQIMAQIGSFVPAQYASFRIADQIFSRIGSDDHMESNSSTFTLEARTSAEEGVGLCWAICEHLLKTQAYTFFVTHFKQLADLNKNYPNVANYFFEVQRTFNAEANCEKISFTHMLSRGITPETHYGLHLAQLSSMPSSVIEDARKIAAQIEKQKQKNQLHDKELIRDHAVFNLATRIIQVAKNSCMDEDSLRAYLASLKHKYLTELSKADAEQSSTTTNESSP
ncbi:MutS protein homolog 4-like [Elysia marginata]|uniref:MutS protein homolog 4-like n=1 Tax=Elysia marginata TaxID=1093978 RepID=A0AAV4IK89_9GAST|nr:MutS protein homolog 4-like [Elysia marginata]